MMNKLKQTSSIEQLDLLYFNEEKNGKLATMLVKLVSSICSIETLVVMHKQEGSHRWTLSQWTDSTTAVSEWISTLDQTLSSNEYSPVSCDELKSKLLKFQKQNSDFSMLDVLLDEVQVGLVIVQFSTVHDEEKEKLALTLLQQWTNELLLTIGQLEKEKMNSFLYNSMMDSMKASIYVTDIDTGEILFMNQTMKDAFHLDHPEGQVCWKVLQSGMKRQCPFCPVRELRKQKDKVVIQWEEKNTLLAKSYRNYDSLIPWYDGRVVHCQQSIDITELKVANTDDLTQLLTRRPGKFVLQLTLDRLSETRKNVVLCLYDINLLEEINTRFGRAEGDHLVSMIAGAVRSILSETEFAFKLSGDEFVIVFEGSLHSVRGRMKILTQQLLSISDHYEAGISYGLVEVNPESELSGDDLLALADEKMYEQKRKFHIQNNEKKRKELIQKNTAHLNFDYDHHYLYDALLQSTDDYIYICNMKTGVFRYSQAMVEEFALPGQVIDNAAAIWGSKVHEEDRQAFLEANQEIVDGRTTTHSVEYRAMNHRKEWVWVHCRGHLEFDQQGEPVLFAGFISNLGKKNQLDHLTGLFNRLEFEDQISHWVELDSKKEFFVMVLGIDNLKHINDLYNRAFGDEVIRITSQRIQSLAPTGSLVYRLDGDEFGILLKDVDQSVITRFYQNISHTFLNQQEYDGKKYSCNLSAGCAYYPADATTVSDLIKYAGYCLEYSKKNGKKRNTFFSSQILAHRSRSLKMVELLRESVENEFVGFWLLYQPLVEASSGKLIGAEALARWTCEEIGDVSPMEFIPLLEQSGLIVPFGQWVIEKAIITTKSWCLDIPDFVLDVNLSYRQLQSGNFIEFLQSILHVEKFNPKNLVVELTESYFANADQQLQTTFKTIRDMGVRIAMDDFGTGYSTLGILKESPADIVKIDKTFIRDILSSTFDLTFIRFIVALCHDVDILVCLEGVETQAVYDIVSHMGLDLIQGYLFNKPLTVQQFQSTYHLGGKQPVS